MTRSQIEARIEELRGEFNHCGLCNRLPWCSDAAMCFLGEISEEEEQLRAKLKNMSPD